MYNQPQPQPQNGSQPPYTPQPGMRKPNLAAIIVPLAIVLLIVAGVVALLLAGKSISDPTTGMKVEPKVGSLAPDFELKDLSTGKTIKLSSLRGRPVWVNFWATWCPPCREEMPDMEKIYGEYKNKDLAILGVDVQEDAGKINQFTQSLELTWSFMLDASGDTANRYEVTGMPSHFFVDKYGVIQAIHVGGFNSTTDAITVDPRSYLAKIVGP